MRFALDIAYHGAAYGGWQVQPNAPTVQAEVERALSTVLRHPVSVVGAGRTDAGVHAEQLIAHFDTEEVLPERFFAAVNGLLPADVAVRNVLGCADDFHARFDAVARTYRYQIVFQKDPFQRDRALWVRRSLDVAAMQDAARILPDYEDFASFCKARGAHKTTFCKMMRAEWMENGGELHFVVQANRFLRGMVRALVGTLLEVGTGKITIERFHEIIEARDRQFAGPNVAPHGLFLTQIRYAEGAIREL